MILGQNQPLCETCSEYHSIKLLNQPCVGSKPDQPAHRHIVLAWKLCDNKLCRLVTNTIITITTIQLFNIIQ